MRAALVLAAVLGLGAAPRALFAPEQGRLLLERNRLSKSSWEAWEAGKHREAFADMEKALAMDTSVVGPWHRATAALASTLAHMHQARGEWADEARHRRAVLEACRRLDGEGHWRTTDARIDLAEALAQAGRTPAERDAVRQARAMDVQAVELLRRGKAAQAASLARRALALRDGVRGDRHPDYASALSNLAGMYKEMGDFRAALPLLEKAAALRKAVLGERHPEYAIALSNLSSLLQNLGDRKAALPLAWEAVALRKKAVGERHPDYAGCLNTLAILLAREGDQGRALRLFQQAAAINKAEAGEGSPDYARSLDNIAWLHHQRGDLEAAIPLCEMALGIYKEALGGKHPRYATCLLNLSTLLSARGDRKGALPLARESVAIMKEALGERHPDYAVALNNLSVLLDEMGDHKAALPLCEQALAIAERRLRDNAAVLSDRQQLAAAEAVRVYRHNRLLLADGEGHPPAAAHALAWKGALLLRQTQRRLFIRLSADPATRAAADRLQAVTLRLAALRESPEATRVRLEALEKEQDEAQARLSGLSADFRASREKGRRPAEELAASLPEGVALVDYHFYHRKLVAFVHRRDKPALRVDLGDAAPVVAAVRRWRQLLVGGEEGLAAGAALKRLVFSPLERHVEGAKVVLVSPDGALGTVPFAALPGRKKGGYLIEDVALAVVPVPGSVPEMLKPVGKGDRHAPSLLVVGDLRYEPAAGDAAPPAGEDSRAAARTGRERFGPLPATRAETLAVRASFERLFKGGKTTALIEGEATKKAVREALPRVRYAHLATHGFFTPEGAEGAWHPLLMSGLALSDAGRAPKGGEEDGILTALEVSEMDLTKLELAVLSACETGLGKETAGEGMFGLQRAFQAAGCRSVVASLWKVDDKATQALMTDFYVAAWDTRKVISRAEALRAAQMAMLREGRRRGIGKDAEKAEDDKGKRRLPPYYWAAFVLSGDWR